MEAPDESPDESATEDAVEEPVVGEPVQDEVEPPVEEPAESPTQDAVEEPVPVSEPEPVPWPAAFEEPAGVGAPHPREWPWQEPEVTGRDDPASRRHRVLPILLAGLVLVLVVAGAAVAVHLLRGSGLGVVASSTPETRRYVAPVPVSAGTAFVSTEVLDPQSLRVTHWIHTDRPVSRVRISAPRVPGVAADAVGVSDLVVASGSQTVGGVTAPGPGSARVYVVPPGRWIYVSYVLTGVLQHSGTPAGRALAPLTALGVSTDQDPVVSSLHRVEGAQVLALACSSTRSPTALVRPCGTVHGGTWQVELHAPHTSDRVLAQMNLS
jgi:hypothetical protein